MDDDDGYRDQVINFVVKDDDDGDRDQMIIFCVKDDDDADRSRSVEGLRSEVKYHGLRLPYDH